MFKKFIEEGIIPREKNKNCYKTTSFKLVGKRNSNKKKTQERFLKKDSILGLI